MAKCDNTEGGVHAGGQVNDLLLPFVGDADASMETTALAALALGLVHVASAQEDAVEAILQVRSGGLVQDDCQILFCRPVRAWLCLCLAETRCLAARMSIFLGLNNEECRHQRSLQEHKALLRHRCLLHPGSRCLSGWS